MYGIAFVGVQVLLLIATVPYAGADGLPGSFFEALRTKVVEAEEKASISDHPRKLWKPGKIVAKKYRRAYTARAQAAIAVAKLESHDFGQSLQKLDVLPAYSSKLCSIGREQEALQALRTWLDDLHQFGDREKMSIAEHEVAKNYIAKGKYKKAVAHLTKVAQETQSLGSRMWWVYLQLHFSLSAAGNSVTPRSGRIGRSLCHRTHEMLGFKTIDSRLCEAGSPSANRMQVAFLPASTVSDFKSYGHAVWRNLLSEDTLKYLQAYYANVAQKAINGELHGYVQKDQSQNRYGFYNENIAAYFHYMLAIRLRESPGLDLTPTYVFSVVYEGGGQLDRHLDRRENEVSITLSLGSDPPGYTSPLHMASMSLNSSSKNMTYSNDTTYLLHAGDAVLYRGSLVLHWRELLPLNFLSTHIIFGYRMACECCATQPGLPFASRTWEQAALEAKAALQKLSHLQ